ncbi:MAG: hypothetical protein CMO61_03020 [Verrucomicrobiales bacterium]|nr:hypothetical protein [Verrucomicrobiales bacterium]
MGLLTPVSGMTRNTEPVTGFLSIGPHELRIEALVEIAAFREIWELPEAGLDEISREVVISEASEAMMAGFDLIEPKLTHEAGDLDARFITFDAEKGFLEDERKVIPIEEAVIGLSLRFDRSLIQAIELDWHWMGPGQDRVAIEISSSGEAAGRFVTSEQSRVTWKSEGGSKATPESPVPPVKRVATLPFQSLNVAVLLFFMIGIVVLLRKGIKSSARVALFFLAGAVMLFVSRVERDSIKPLAGEELEDAAYGLLKNIYRAFEFGQESAIYDALDKSIEGDLLETVYLEIRESLELESVGGPRVRVYEVALRECKSVSVAGSDEFWSVAEWVTIGEVTHWGHTHERTNKYEARLRLTPVEDVWKLSGLELLSEEREQKVSRNKSASSK